MIIFIISKQYKEVAAAAEVSIAAGDRGGRARKLVCQLHTQVNPALAPRVVASDSFANHASCQCGDAHSHSGPARGHRAPARRVALSWTLVAAASAAR